MGISVADWPRLLLTIAARRMPAERGEWGAAMLAELAQLHDPLTRWRFALGCTRVALFPPRQGGLLQTTMKHTMKSTSPTLRFAAVISFLLVLPLMILDFWFQIVNKPTALSLKNYTDFVVLFGFLWFGLAAIIFILMPAVRNRRAGSDIPASPVLTQGNAIKNILTNPRSAAMISIILALPFLTLLSLLLLNIEPPFADLLKNPNPDQPDVLGSLIALGSFLLAVAACIIARAPIVRTMQAGGSLFAHPVNLMLAVVILSFVTMLVVGLIADQLPCFLGVPNCD